MRILPPVMALVALIRAVSSFRSPSPVAFREPVSVYSHAGVLGLKLRARRSTVDIGGRQAVAAVYKGGYVPPTLRVRAEGRSDARFAGPLLRPRSRTESW